MNLNATLRAQRSSPLWRRLGQLCAKLAWVLSVMLMANTQASAQELLINRSFELPVAPANGNNFYATIPNWTAINVTPAQANPFNIIKPAGSYGGGPHNPPTGGGVQYVDVNSASGQLRQTFTIPSHGMIDYSGWFSVRDSAQALTGLTINIINSSSVVVSTVSTSFVLADPFRTWRQAARTNIPIAPGTYTFEVVLPNPANFDLASLVFKPALTVTKTSAPYWDPINAFTNPKLIPGGIVEYTISGTTPSSYSVTSNTVFVIDATPANTDLIVTNIGGAGSGPAAFSAGTTGMTYTFTSLASATDDISFSSNGGSTWVYTPVANVNNVDTNITHVRLNPKLSMAASSTFSFRLRYRIR